MDDPNTRIMKRLNTICLKLNTTLPPSSKLPHKKYRKCSSHIIMKGDSAATGHYIRPNDTECLSHLRHYSGPAVTLPDNDKIAATQQGNLHIHNTLSTSATKATVLPRLKNSSLISLGQLCDDNCPIVLDKQKLYALKNKTVIMEGIRNQEDGLWDIPIQKTTLQSDHFAPVPSHGGLYATSLTKHHSTQKIQYKCENASNMSTSTPYNHLFSGLDSLIESNQTDQAIDYQLRQDSKNLQKVTENGEH